MPYKQGPVRRATRLADGARYALIWAAIAIVLVISLNISAFLRALGDFLQTRDPLAPASFIYVLGGHYEVRAPHAAFLFHEGWAPRIVMAREQSQLSGPPYTNFTDVTGAILLRQGVPAENILQIGRDRPVTSTGDEANRLREYIVGHPAPRVIVVTSNLHSRRAAMIFNRALRGTGTEILSEPAADPELEANSWWKTARGRYGLAMEYLKFAYYAAVFR